MKDIKEKYSSILAIIGALASIIGIMLAVFSIKGIKSELIIGIFGSVVASLIVYLFTYLKGYKKEIDITKQSIEALRNEIKFKLDEKDRVINKPKIFLSYSHNDRDKARQIANELRKANLDIWFDEYEIKVGESLIEKIRQAMGKSNYVVMIISKDSVKSKWLNKELDIAIKANKKILPILIDNVNLPEQVSSIKYADFNKDYNKGLTDLLESLNIDIKINNE